MRTQSIAECRARHPHLQTHVTTTTYPFQMKTSRLRKVYLATVVALTTVGLQAAAQTVSSSDEATDMTTRIVNPNFDDGAKGWTNTTGAQVKISTAEKKTEASPSPPTKTTGSYGQVRPSRDAPTRPSANCPKGDMWCRQMSSTPPSPARSRSSPTTARPPSAPTAGIATPCRVWSSTAH